MNKTYRDDLPVTEICDGVWLLDEFGGTNCYLVTGSEKALLIDCGTGFCDISSAVKKLTDLPLTVAATHGHVDHFGGAGRFPEIYVHKDDCRPFNMFQRTRFVRTLFLLSAKHIRDKGFGPSDVSKPQFDTRIIPFDESITFDLGGKIIRVKSTPGHSRGSVAFIDDADKIIFSGDNVCDALWMFVPGCTSVEEWLPGAEWLCEMADSYRIFWGHSSLERSAEINKETIVKVIAFGKELLSVTKKNSLFSKISQYPSKPDGIIYRTGNVLKKKRKT